MNLNEILEPPFFNDIQYDFPWDDYLPLPGMNPSRIVHGFKSMLQLWQSNEPRDEKPDRGKLIGSMTHTLIFEPEFFNNRFAVYQGVGTRATKDYKKFALEHHSREVTKPNEYDTAVDVSAAVRRDPLAREIIDATRHEVTVRCEYKGMLLKCKGRLDCYGDGIIADLKTTTDVSPDKFGRVAANLHYTSKLGLYREFIARVTGEICEVKVIAVETEPPYDVVVYKIPEIVLDNAMEKVDRIMDKLPECIINNHWPGVADGRVMDFPVPNWAMSEEELDWSQ